MLVSFLIILVTYPARVIDNRRAQKRYLDYLSKLNDKYFLCYNEQEPHKSFLERSVLPHLPKTIDIIFLEGKVPLSDHPATFVIHLLNNIQNREGLPHLIKIKNGEILHQSILNELTLEGNLQGKELLLNKILFFFEIRPPAKLQVI